MKPKFQDDACEILKLDELVLPCDCGALDHGIKLGFIDMDENDKWAIDLLVYITPNSFFQRIKWIWRILFKTHHINEWSNTLIRKTDAKKLKDFLEQVDWSRNDIIN